MTSPTRKIFKRLKSEIFFVTLQRKIEVAEKRQLLVFGFHAEMLRAKSVGGINAKPHFMGN